MSASSDKLGAIVNEFAAEHDKFEEKSNNAAATRARKKLMELIKAAREMRDEIQDARGTKKAA